MSPVGASFVPPVPVLFRPLSFGWAPPLCAWKKQVSSPPFFQHDVPSCLVWHVFFPKLSALSARRILGLTQGGEAGPRPCLPDQRWRAYQAPALPKCFRRKQTKSCLGLCCFHASRQEWSEWSSALPRSSAFVLPAPTLLTQKQKGPDLLWSSLRGPTPWIPSQRAGHLPFSCKAGRSFHTAMFKIV